MSVRDNGVTTRLINQLLQDIVTGKRQAGEHLNAKTIAEQYQVSRTPVRDALNELEKFELVERKPNCGYFVVERLSDEADQWARRRIENIRDEYQMLVDDWLKDRVPSSVTELYVRERYGWSKVKANALMTRATREGWAERKPGYGWVLLPVAKTAEAFNEIYRFRMAIEPAALLEPTFTLDRKVISEQRDIQNRILDSEEGSISDELILEYGPMFHEALVGLSGNHYFLTALQRVNRMRKLMEYKASISRERLELSCTEHLEILDMLEHGGPDVASAKLYQHLSKALKTKSPNLHS